MDPVIILKSASLLPTVLKYLGVIEDKVGGKLDLLAGSEFDAGRRALTQAVRSDTERESLFREARSRFNKAAGLEKGWRLTHTHLGLALCHLALGDLTNADAAIADAANTPVDLYSGQMFKPGEGPWGSIFRRKREMQFRRRLAAWPLMRQAAERSGRELDYSWLFEAIEPK